MTPYEEWAKEFPLARKKVAISVNLVYDDDDPEAGIFCVKQNVAKFYALPATITPGDNLT